LGMDSDSKPMRAVATAAHRCHLTVAARRTMTVEKSKMARANQSKIGGWLESSLTATL
jgi:hypothetical protein